MSRVALVAAAAAISGVALAGCSSMPMPDWMSSSMPDWMSRSSAPGPQALRFESVPPGADVRTAQGMTCRAPCSLIVPTERQPVTFAMVGFVPQTVQINVGEPPEHSFWESPPPLLVPNPVVVSLQPIPPPPPRMKPRPRRHVSSTRTGTQIAAPGPASPPPGASPFPPPPPTR